MSCHGPVEMPTQFRAKSLTELLVKRVLEEPDAPYIYTAVPEPNDKLILRYLTNAQTQRAVDRLAAHYASIPGLLPEKHPETSVPPVRIVGVWTSSSIDETLLEIALAKLGLTPLLLSVNNSILAIANLLSLTHSVRLIYGPKFADAAIQVQNLLRAEYSISASLIPDQRYPIWGKDGIDEWSGPSFPAVLTPEQEERRPAVILHSSGSTGFPKPVYVTHYGLIANISLNQNLPAFTTLPVFHGYGHFALFRCMYSSQPITLFPGHLPLTAANICAVIDARETIAKERGETHGGMRQCFAVPYVIKLMGESEEGVKRLVKFDVVSYAGAPLPDDLGDRLTAAGVKLLSILGTTETGTLMNSMRDFATDKLWNWVVPVPDLLPYLVLEPRGKQKTKEGEAETFEVVVKDGYPPKIESNRPDKSYATKDLLLQHPKHTNRLRYIGRLDDTLVHTLGEKTNPVPMELCIRGNSPYVQEAIVFGAGRPQTGCLILPSQLAEDEGYRNGGGWKEAELMEKIWPVIEQANHEAPTHSRLLPEMIAFLPPNTYIPVATKLSILRPSCYTQFAAIINEIYHRFDSASSGKESIDFHGDQSEAETYLLKTIERTLGPTAKKEELDINRDLFEFGIDSLQATRVRNSIVKEVHLNGVDLGQNVVYECGCVKRLASYILSLQAQAQVDASVGSISEQQLMEEMVEKWVAKVISPASRIDEQLPKPENERVVLLTGATGSLGAHILHSLVRSSKVRKVITLSRARDDDDSLRRVEQSLRERRVDEILLDPPLRSKIQSYAANFNSELLGLSQAHYDSIRNEVTDVIHNAWPVNFALSLSSFDAHIGGVVNLLNLVLSSDTPANFFFSSSISSRQAKPNPDEAWEGQDPVCQETFPESTETAVSTGYARSKWVVEKICQRVGKNLHQSRYRIGILRIGQIVGDSVTGIWNETEAWPVMFKSVQTLGALPETDEYPSWLPVDFAARAIVEILFHNLSQDTASVYHILNPNATTSWPTILDALEASGLVFRRLDKLEWVGMLESNLKDAEGKGKDFVEELTRTNPAVKLASFYRMRYSSSLKPMQFVTTETAKVSPSIRDAPALSQEMIGTWVQRWRESEFLH